MQFNFHEKLTGCAENVTREYIGPRFRGCILASELFLAGGPSLELPASLAGLFDAMMITAGIFTSSPLSYASEEVGYY